MTNGPAKTWTVYAICDPRTGLPFYIGQTNNYERRQRQHLEHYRPKNYRSTHIKAMLDAGVTPTFRVLGTAANSAEALALEHEQIDRHAKLRLLLGPQKAAHFIEKRRRAAPATAADTLTKE